MGNKLYLCVAAAALTSLGFGQNAFVASSDNWGYQGSLKRYNTLADAQAGQNEVSHASFDRRDGSLYVLQNRPDFDPVSPNGNVVETAWYYTTADNTNGYAKDDPRGNNYYSGYGNPNNTNLSFMQLNENGESRLTASGNWTDGTYSSFHVLETGANATYATSFSRMWDGLSLAPDGTFVNYSLDATFSGLAGVFDGTYYTSTNEPTSVLGTFKGIFHNNSTSDSSNNGYYVFNLTMDQSTVPWAIQQGDDALNGDFFTSVFSAAPVPEPASLTALGLGALALLRRRRASRCKE